MYLYEIVCIHSKTEIKSVFTSFAIFFITKSIKFVSCLHSLLVLPGTPLTMLPSWHLCQQLWYAPRKLAVTLLIFVHCWFLRGCVVPCVCVFLHLQTLSWERLACVDWWSMALSESLLFCVYLLTKCAQCYLFCSQRLVITFYALESRNFFVINVNTDCKLLYWHLRHPWSYGEE